MTATETKKDRQAVVLRETEIQAFMDRYPGLERKDVLFTIARSGPSRRDIDDTLARMWSDQVLHA